MVDIDDKTHPRSKSDLHQITEDRSERLDMMPAKFRVVVTRRPKYPAAPVRTASCRPRLWPG